MKTKFRRQANALIFGGAAAWGLLLVSCVVNGNAPLVAPRIPGATLVGSQKCAQCHDEVSTQFHDRTHGQLVAAQTAGAELGCESCHGAASEHVKTGGEDGTILAGPGLCASCHQEVQARFGMTSHHPLTEGGVTCTSCHAAHGDKQTTLTSTNTLCTSCHQSVRGPHAFEHAPAAENCANCHNPHGSPMRKMLTTAEPMLCLQCHSLANNRHGQTAATANGTPFSGAALRQCSSCHSAVHGSSQDEHLRY